MWAHIARLASFGCKDDVMTGTGNHVFLGGETADQWKKGSRAHETGSHVFWDGKPLTSEKKGSWAQGGVKPRRNAGAKSKVQFEHRGWPLE